MAAARLSSIGATSGLDGPRGGASAAAGARCGSGGIDTVDMVGSAGRPPEPPSGPPPIGAPSPSRRDCPSVIRAGSRSGMTIGNAGPAAAGARAGSCDGSRRLTGDCSTVDVAGSAAIGERWITAHPGALPDPLARGGRTRPASGAGASAAKERTRLRAGAVVASLTASRRGCSAAMGSGNPSGAAGSSCGSPALVACLDRSGDRCTGAGMGGPCPAATGRAMPATSPRGASRLRPWDRGLRIGAGGSLEARDAANGRFGATSGGGPTVSTSGGSRRQAPPDGTSAGAETPSNDAPPSDDALRCARLNGHGSRMLPYSS